MKLHLIYLNSLIVLGCFVTNTSFAKVTPITAKRHQLTSPFKDGGTSSGNKNTSITCADRGLLDRDPNNNTTCKQKKISGSKYCYECWCDRGQYAYDQEAPTGFVLTGDTCEQNGNTYHSAAICDNSKGYYRSINNNAVFVPNGGQTTVSYKGLTCYNATSYTCKEGSKKVSSEKIEGTELTVEYTFENFLGEGSHDFICTTGVDRITGDGLIHYIKQGGDKYSGRTRAQTEAVRCTDVGEGETAHGATYWYYTGLCLDSNNCLSTSDYENLDSCIDTGNNGSVKDYKGNSITCYYVTGCKDDGSGTGCRGESKNITLISKTTVNYTDISQGGFTCRKINGCMSGYYNTEGSNAWLNKFIN